jgi:hypothetical protein
MSLTFTKMSKPDEYFHEYLQEKTLAIVKNDITSIFIYAELYMYLLH